LLPGSSIPLLSRMCVTLQAFSFSPLPLILVFCQKVWEPSIWGLSRSEVGRNGGIIQTLALSINKAGHLLTGVNASLNMSRPSTKTTNPLV
jgi:hypothetical protein